MLSYVVKRILRSIPQLLLISIVAFIVIQLPPGDFADLYFDGLRNLGASIPDEAVEAFRRQHGLDRPMVVQYVAWMRDILLHLDFGHSLYYDRPVGDVILGRIPLTFAIALGSLAFTWGVGIPLGVFVASRQGTLADYVLTMLSFVAMSIPPFLLGLLVMYLLATKAHISADGLFSPAMRTQPWSWAKFVDLLGHLLLPIVLVGTSGVAGTVRVMRATMLDELHQPYVTVARAKGLPERLVLLRYPLRLALSPIISSLNRLLPWLFSAGFLVDIILSLPTASHAMGVACFTQDIYLAGSYILIIGALTPVSAVCSDILLATFDPRIRFGRD
ncbi:MAG: ABC transporter permease [Anaerolineae bacterium]|nr:ABC transporter permease [Anaerolineae bacterium]